MRVQLQIFFFPTLMIAALAKHTVKTRRGIDFGAGGG
ncbi:hypothetical protein Trydic_g12318, partial [Trypoxylus dichotomus]